jgi:uncharacterized membrane protein YsdA (DUF1294 family)
MCYAWFFGILAAILSAIGYVLVYDYTSLHPYLGWLAAINAVTFVMYGVDDLFCKQGKAKTPEAVMHALMAAGGYVGAWLGRALFGFKLYWDSNPWVQIGLILAAIAHAIVAYNLLVVGPELLRL